MNKIIGLSLIIGIISLSLCSAQEFKLFRLSDKVGDTIDSIEREQYSLFPGITNFESARILILNDNTYLAEINPRYRDTESQFFLKLTPNQVERLTYCIENSDTIKKKVASDEYSSLALKRFWDSIESQRIATIDEKEKISFLSSEGRIIGTLTGITVGSGIGGYIGASLGIKYSRSYVEDDCMGWGTKSVSVYRVDNNIFWSAACIGTAVGTIAGYKLGELRDQNYLEEISSAKEGRLWRNYLVGASIIPGLALGVITFVFVSRLNYMGGSSEIENDPYSLTKIPGLLAGTALAIDIIYLGYQIGKSIDRKKAIQAAKEKENKK